MSHDFDRNEQELQLLYRVIKRAKGFQLFLAQFDNQDLREKIQASLKQQLESEGITVYYQHLNSPMVSLDEFLPAGFTIHENEKAVLLVSGLENSINHTAEPQAFLHRLNYARDLLPKKIPIPLLLWLPEAVFKKILTEAHDLWSWRSGTFYFSEMKDLIKSNKKMVTTVEKEKPKTISEKYYKEQLAYFINLLEDLKTRDNTGATQLHKADVMQQISELHYSYANTLLQPAQKIEYLEKALEFQIKAQEIIELLMGTFHPEAARCYANLSSIYQDMNDNVSALAYAEKAVDILQDFFPHGHPNLSTAKRNLEILKKRKAGK
ncbi:MAG TPA: tetratricopeptide repeat protein [Candidatus Kapabacteria bacterium]|nr:tetratricopeptide repeat protein [Candidatus Kapabacteria bacterium]